MEQAAVALEAIGESIVFLDHFKELPDPRQRGKITYPLGEVLLLCLLAVLGGAETFVDIARFGEKKIDLLRRFRPFRDGTPSHDHLGDIFATLDAEAFQRCFVSWVAALTGVPAEVVAIDGKTLRRSYQKKGAKAPIHMVSAFAARQRLVLGQVKVRPPDIADFRDWNHWRFCDWRCAPIPVRFFDFGWRNRLEGCGFWGGVCGRKDVRSSSAHEHPTSLGAALAGGVEYRGDQCALQLAN